MKIIKRGVEKIMVLQGTCTNCNSVVQALPSELHSYHCSRERVTIYDGICPVCAKRMNFGKKFHMTQQEWDSTKTA